MQVFTLCVAMVLALCLSKPTRSQGSGEDLNKVYADESHCLVAPEIRSKLDNPVSCYCRDAIVDARYVYHTYLLTGKDRNLNGVYLSLETRADQICGDNHGVHKSIQKINWKWSGPEVTRTYPPDDTIERIKPDAGGFRMAEYLVNLTYRDGQGKITKAESFTAKEKLPPNLRK